MVMPYYYNKYIRVPCYYNLTQLMYDDTTAELGNFKKDHYIKKTSDDCHN